MHGKIEHVATRASLAFIDVDAIAGFIQARLLAHATETSQLSELPRIDPISVDHPPEDDHAPDGLLETDSSSVDHPSEDNHMPNGNDLNKPFHESTEEES